MGLGAAVALRVVLAGLLVVGALVVAGYFDPPE